LLLLLIAPAVAMGAAGEAHSRFGPVLFGLAVLVVVAKAGGLLAERWTFFAEAKHPQNLYYQAIS